MFVMILVPVQWRIAVGHKLEEPKWIGFQGDFL